MGEKKLREEFGKFGEWLYTKSFGRDIDAYVYGEEPKSISHETTFDEDISDLEELERDAFLSVAIGGAAVARPRPVRAHARIEASLRAVPDSHPRRHYRRADHLDSVIFENVLHLFENTYDAKMKVRLLGRPPSNLERAVFQRNLLEAPQRDKLNQIFQAADKLRERFGFEPVNGTVFEPAKGKKGGSARIF